jgi:GrpB-like predicted nucleotidyltransferase (UPF0157 family)
VSRADWPAWATEPISVVEPDPAWADRAAGLTSGLRGLLAPWLDGEIEHVGSTAVPALAAKPTIDLIAPVRSLEESAAATPLLEEAGWHLVPPHLDERPWRRLHLLPDGSRRVAHLHIVERSHPRWAETIRFRDALRAEPDLAARYAELKRAAARDHRGDREAYTEAKADFVHQTLTQR